jgi:hypothetical protein
MIEEVKQKIKLRGITAGKLAALYEISYSRLKLTLAGIRPATEAEKQVFEKWLK